MVRHESQPGGQYNSNIGPESATSRPKRVSCLGETASHQMVTVTALICTVLTHGDPSFQEIRSFCSNIVCVILLGPTSLNLVPLGPMLGPDVVCLAVENLQVPRCRDLLASRYHVQQQPRTSSSMNQIPFETDFPIRCGTELINSCDILVKFDQ